MTRSIKEKTILISGPAADRMKQEQTADQHYKVEIAAFNWGGPIYRLVQTSVTGDDLAITDPQSGMTVYASKEETEFFDDLEISLAKMFSDEVLIVKERF